MYVVCICLYGYKLFEYNTCDRFGHLRGGRVPLPSIRRFHGLPMDKTWSPFFLNFMSNASLLEESMGTGCNPSYAIPLYSQRGESNGTCWNFVAGSHQFSRVYMLP